MLEICFKSNDPTESKIQISYPILTITVHPFRPPYPNHFPITDNTQKKCCLCWYCASTNCFYNAAVSVGKQSFPPPDVPFPPPLLFQAKALGFAFLSTPVLPPPLALVSRFGGAQLFARVLFSHLEESSTHHHHRHHHRHRCAMYYSLTRHHGMGMGSC